MFGKLSILKGPLALCFLPLLEFIGLRYVVRHVMGMKFGYVGITDYDFVFPALFSFLILASVLQRGQRLIFSISKTVLIANGALVAAFLILTAYFYDFSYPWAEFVPYVWTFLGFAIVISAFFVPVSPSFFFKNPSRKFILPAILVAETGILSKKLYPILWEPVAKLSGQTICFVMEPWYPGLKCTMTSSLLLYGKQFALAIGTGCSGLDSMVFFLFGMGLIALIEWRRFSPFVWGGLFTLGILYSFLLNVLRISLFYVISSVAFAVAGDERGVQVVLGLFHVGMGWVIYGIGFALYFHWVLQRLQQSSLGRILRISIPSSAG